MSWVKLGRGEYGNDRYEYSPQDEDRITGVIDNITDRSGLTPFEVMMAFELVRNPRPLNASTALDLMYEVYEYFGNGTVWDAKEALSDHANVMEVFRPQEDEPSIMAQIEQELDEIQVATSSIKAIKKQMGPAYKKAMSAIMGDAAIQGLTDDVSVNYKPDAPEGESIEEHEG